MLQLIPIALIAWIPIAVILFSKMPPRRALMVGVLGATMFLPMGTLELPMVPFNKLVCTNVGLLIGALLMAPGPLMAFRPRLVDLPVVILTFVPYAAATANGMAPYDAFASTVTSGLLWTAPYVLGRAYLTDAYALRDAAQSLFVAALVYAPLCMIEMAMSPILHIKVYGMPAHPDFMQGYRLGGWRPVLFMQHGLQVGLFMCAGALVGIWMWRNGALRPVKKLPLWAPVMFVTAIAILCKSTGAVLLFAVALVILFAVKFSRNGIIVYVLALAPLGYIGARTVGGWQGENAVQMATEYISKEHGGSLQTRFDNENILVNRALTKAALGWGRMDDFLIKDADGRITSIPDGLWVIQLGTTGLVGLFALVGAMLAPTIAVIRRFPAKMWSHPAMAAPGALAIFCATYVIDCLMNAMLNPVYVVLMGGLASFAVAANPMARPAGAAVARGAKPIGPNRPVPNRPPGTLAPSRG